MKKESTSANAVGIQKWALEKVESHYSGDLVAAGTGLKIAVTAGGDVKIVIFHLINLEPETTIITHRIKHISARQNSK